MTKEPCGESVQPNCDVCGRPVPDGELQTPRFLGTNLFGPFYHGAVQHVCQREYSIRIWRSLQTVVVIVAALMLPIAIVDQDLAFGLGGLGSCGAWFAFGELRVRMLRRGPPERCAQNTQQDRTG